MKLSRLIMFGSAAMFAIFTTWIVSPSLGRAQESTTMACATSIAACGCTITKTGTYTVTTDLSSTQGVTSAGDCIAIKASSVILNADEHSITGPGSGTSTGAGIDVLKSSSGAFIEANSNLDDWKYGLEVQGKNTIVDDSDDADNVVGVFLSGATGANINAFEANNNTIYGVWIKGGKGNQVNSFSSIDNTETGVYIGCHDDDTRGTKCAGVPSSSGNRIYDFRSGGNGDAGMVIDLGNQENLLIGASIGANTGGLDSIDENPSCGTDQWIDDGSVSFGVTSQSCIP